MLPFTNKPARLQAPDSDLRTCKALIIDTNQTSRSILRSMLADLGLTGIIQASKMAEARRALETRSFDVVLCDYHFDDCGMTGSDLLDDLRRAQLLPYSTVFVMVTSEASYVKVAEAAESALDCYLLKPHTANALAQRLQHRRAHAPLGRQAGGQAFQRAPQLDRIGHFAFRKSAHRIATTGQGRQQAFLLEVHQRCADGGARHAQAVHQGQLGNARTCGQVTGQDQLAQALLRLDGL